MKTFAAILIVCLTTATGADDAAKALIAQAGNAKDEHERQASLEKLAALPSLDESQRTEAKALGNFVEKWNGSALKFYGACVRRKPHRAIGDYDFGVAADFALRPVDAANSRPRCARAAVRIERGRRTTVPVTLPARKHCVLRIEPAP